MSERVVLLVRSLQNVTRAHRNINIAAVVLPFVAFLAAIPMLWNDLVGPLDLALFLLIYAVSTIGITVGYHRLLTHRAFATYKPVEYLYAILGSHAVEEGDPHSPHVDHDGETPGPLRGLYHAHIGWLFQHATAVDAEKYAPDLVEDRGMRLIHRLFPLWVTLGLVIPVTFSINSICHFFGRRRFQTDDRSTNVAWLAVPSFGESWHHNHHAFPRSAMHGLRWWEIDLGGVVIRAMRRVGLAWNVVMISPERQEQRKVEAARKLRPTAPALERASQ